ncbi:MAG: chromosome segregation protein SMC [Chloroflexia bacterium]|nr:chromosome segregation protein SMC [Chloroflexia bacterium]
MRVRRLEMQGFKTFASKTVFEFREGITAVVGPNGSGKSNLADALRWVLGEQSYSTLRSRRTEDVIFSGSSSRPPMGLAEVSLLLDNEDGYLPVDFAEVEIRRRAHRSGTNEYYLNRRRVRLQDIQEVLGGLTSSYVVIHQGLVDEALSLRPQERRLLLEEAAEVRRYHDRRRKAQDRLARTESNMTRVADLQSEIAPRLQKLERQAEQARRYSATDTSLRRELRLWYRLLWHEGSSELDQARQRSATVEEQLAQARAELEGAQAQTQHLRQSMVETQRRQQERWQQQEELHQQEELLRQELAQVEGEQRALRRYAEELTRALADWRQEVAEGEQRLQEAQSTDLELEQRVEQLQSGLEEQRASLQQDESSLQELRDRLGELRQGDLDLAGQLMGAERRQEGLQVQQATWQAEQTELQTVLADLAGQKAPLSAGRQEAEAELALLAQGLTEQQARYEAAERRLQQARSALAGAQERLEAARWQLTEQQARLEALLQSGGPTDGTAFLQNWALERGRPAFETLLSQLQVPPGLEAALESALGEYVTALLVADWTGAQAALDALSAVEAGRASLLPLAELPTEASRPEDLAQDSQLLLDALGLPARPQTWLLAVLGRVLLAEDAASARRIARELSPGWRVVTPQGLLVTSEGVVAGGRLPAAQSALAREQERRALERDLAALREQLEQWTERQRAAQQELAAAQDDCEALRQRLAEQRLQRQELQGRIQEYGRNLAWLEAEEGRQQRRWQSLQVERERLLQEGAALKQRLQTLRQQRAELAQEFLSLQGGARQMDLVCAQAREKLQEARTAWAVARTERDNQRSLLEMYRRNLQRLHQQLREGEQRLAHTELQLARWSEQKGVLQQREQALQAKLAALPSLVEPARVSLDDLAHWEQLAAERQQQVVALEGSAGRAEMEVERLQERLKDVLRRGLEEIGPEASAYGQAGEALLNALLQQPPEWARGPLQEDVSRQELERRVAQLREEIRRLGPVNPLAEEEYAQSRERHDFLEQQLQDLGDSIRSLRQVIDELDQAMEDRFRDTFGQINQEFQAYFQRLFGGGTAQLGLVRLDEEDAGLDSLGVEITARPPGKRAHTLALLSGGERALTSAALLFAILKVNPRPFCMLDEVDAMLDEANVGRFRECLEELVQETQFIMITHNRVTIESANTLYGVSLAEDGASRVLSLRLEDALAI